MAAFKVSTTQAAAQTVEQLQDKLLGFPAKGTHIGGGVHVPMPDAWDTVGAVPPGWTSYRGGSRKHPTLSQWATILDPQLSAALADARASRLSGAEQTSLSSAISTAVASLTQDWFP